MRIALLKSARSEPPHSPMGWAATWPILILAFANVCSFADRQLTSILAAPIRTSLHLDHASMALLGGTAFATFYGLAGLPAGWASDRFRRKALICGAILFWSGCTALCGLSTSFRTLFLSRIGVGVGEAVLLPCAFSLIRDLTPAGRRGFAFAIFGLGIPAGSSLGLVVGGWLNTSLAEHAGALAFLGPLAAWQKTFLLLAFLGLPTAAAAALLPDPPRAHDVHLIEHGRRGAGFLAALPYFVAVAAFGIMVQGVAFWTPSWLMEEFKLTTAEVGLRVGLIIIVASTVGMFAIGQASDRMSRRFGSPGAAITLSVASILFIPAVVLLATMSVSAWLGVAAFYFLAIGSTTVASALALRLGPAHRAGLMGALYGLVVNLAGQGFGPLFYGWMKDHTSLSMGGVMVAATVGMAAVAGLAALATAALSRTPAREPLEPAQAAWRRTRTS
jgi:MFS family permease